MKRTLFTFIFLFTIGFSASACLNYYYTADKEGHLHYQGDDHVIMIGFNRNFNRQLLSEKIKKQEEKLKAERTYMALSDYAVMLMKLGKNDVALPILQVLYANHPDQYQLASNLGTAYELAGEVDSALKYIRRGIELNPDDHEGSEWIHVKILETKKKLVDDPDYLTTHTVLDLTPQQEYDSLVGYQIEIQLRERFPFCPGPDMIMSSLMIDLADITMNTTSIEDAKTFYNISKYYFGDSSETVRTKLAEVQRLLSKHSGVRPDPKVPYHMEATNYRLGPYSYTQMLDDNDPNHFYVNWSEINTDVTVLLDIVGLKQPAIVVQTPLANDTIKNIVEGGPQDTPTSGSGWWIGIGIFVLLGLIFGIVLRKKR